MFSTYEKLRKCEKSGIYDFSAFYVSTWAYFSLNIKTGEYSYIPRRNRSRRNIISLTEIAWCYKPKKFESKQKATRNYSNPSIFQNQQKSLETQQNTMRTLRNFSPSYQIYQCEIQQLDNDCPRNSAERKTAWTHTQQQNATVMVDDDDDDNTVRFHCSNLPTPGTLIQ